MKKIRTEKYYSHCEKLEIKSVDKIDRDSVFALVCEFTNGEVGFLPAGREYAYLAKSRQEIDKNWNQIIEDYLDTTDFDLTYFMLKNLSPLLKIEGEVERNISQLDYLIQDQVGSRNYSDLKKISTIIDKYLNKKENINNQEAWIPIGYLLGEIICQQKGCHWYLNKHTDTGFIRFDVRNDKDFYPLWSTFADYFEAVKIGKKKFNLLSVLNSIIKNPEDINRFSSY